MQLFDNNESQQSDSFYGYENVNINLNTQNQQYGEIWIYVNDILFSLFDQKNLKLLKLLPNW